MRVTIKHMNGAVLVGEWNERTNGEVVVLNMRTTDGAEVYRHVPVVNIAWLDEPKEDISE